MAATETNDKLLAVLDFQRKGESWDAMKHLKDLIQAHPENAFYHKLLGNIYFHTGLLDWAIEFYQKAIEVNCDYIDARYDLGVAYYHRGRVSQAVAEYRTVLDLDPNYHAAHYRIGICYHHLMDYDKAIHHLLESTVITPEYVMAHYHLGVIYYKQGEYDRAVVEFKRVLEENPEDLASANYIEMIEAKMEGVS